MSSNPPPAIAATKSANTPGQLSPAQSQPGSAATGDSFGQRRSGGSGSFGAGSASRATPSPRNGQSSRKQHKGSKRPKLVDEDAMAESAAIRSTSSRKGQTSITHLMNFSLPPRPQNQNAHSRGNNYRRNRTWGLGSGYHAVDKARYVHANYRFIVDPRGDYRAQSVDADVHLDWNNVLQILVSAQSQTASCPICLGTPVAPRMARCGHIFCLPCLIRYMHSEDDVKPVLPEKKARSKKCPFCFDNIYISETKPVCWYTGQEGEPPREGGDVVLRLVMRTTGSTLALPRDGAEALGKSEDIPWYLAAEVMDYGRIMKGSEDYMVAQIDRDIQELEQQAKEDELMFGEANVEWVRKAVRMLHEAKEKVLGIGNPPAMPAKPADAKPRKPPIVYESNDTLPDMYSAQDASIAGQSSVDPSSTQGTEALEPSSSGAPRARKLSTASSDSQRSAHLRLHHHHHHRHHYHHHQQTPSEYYFYQALLHYYLEPLDIRILKAAFGDFSAFPSTILPRVEHVSTGHIVDDDLRKQKKYLAHLPSGCEVSFLQCDWTDTVPLEILDQFKSEIETRRKKNQDKETREEKARIRAEKEEDRRWASAHRKRPSIAERWTADDFQPLASNDAIDGAVSLDADSTSTSPPWPLRRGAGSAFASLASPSTSPSAPRTVWGTTAIAPTSPILQATREHHDADDGWLQGWEKDLLLEDDELVAQAQALSLAGESSKQGASANGGSGGGAGGKKKKKKITLMSTNVRRGA